MTVNTDAIAVDPRIAGGPLFHSCDLIGQSVVAHPGVVRVVKRLRSPRRPHPVDLHHHEPKLGQRLSISARRREAATAYTSCLRTRIDVVDEWILSCRIEIRRD